MRDRRTAGAGLATIVVILGALAWLQGVRNEQSAAPHGVRVVPAATLPVRDAPVVARPIRGAGATTDWLVGTWSPRDNGGRRDITCNLPGAITFLADGHFITVQAIGRYAVASGTLTFWNLVGFDVDAGEDRSHVDERTSQAIERRGDHAMALGADRLFRCERRAPDKE